MNIEEYVLTYNHENECSSPTKVSSDDELLTRKRSAV